MIEIGLTRALLQAVTPPTIRGWLLAHGWEPAVWPGRSDAEAAHWWEHTEIGRRGALRVPDTGQVGYAKEVEMIIESILYDAEPQRRATQAILDSLAEAAGTNEE